MNSRLSTHFYSRAQLVRYVSFFGVCLVLCSSFLAGIVFLLQPKQSMQKGKFLWDMNVLLPFTESLICPTVSRSCDCLQLHGQAKGSTCESNEAWESSKKPLVHLAPASGSWFSGEARMGRFDCPHSRCVLQKEKQGADVIVYTLPPLEASSAVADFGWVNHALVSVESCTYYPDACDGHKLMKQFNFTHLFRAQAASNGIWQDLLSYVNTDLLNFRAPAVPTRLKKSAVAVIISNCGDVPSGRKKLLQSLADAGVPLHSFGPCMHNAEIKTHAPECAHLSRGTSFVDLQKLCIIASYRFTASFESVIGDGYVTEKIFQPLLVGSVPIYLGTATVSSILPHQDSAILVSNFSSTLSLANHVLQLLQDDDAYENHLKWRTQPLALNFRNHVRKQYSTLQCRACDGIVLATQLQLCEEPPLKPWRKLELPLDSVSLFVLGIWYQPEQGRIRFLLFFEEFSYPVGPNRMQVDPSGLAMNFHLSLSVGSAQPFATCSKVTQDADLNFVFCPAPQRLLASATNWDLRIQSITTNYVDILPLQLCPLQELQFPPDEEYPRVGICVATIIKPKNSLRLLVDFIEYHLALHVDIITLLMRSDAFMEFAPALRSIYKNNTVVLVDWGVASRDVSNPNRVRCHGYYDQQLAINHCFERSRGQVDWLGVFDEDEYFFTPKYDSVLEALMRISNKDLSISCIVLATDRIHSPFVVPQGKRSVHEIHNLSTRHSMENAPVINAKFFCKPSHFSVAINHLPFTTQGKVVDAPPMTAHFRHYSNLFEQRVPFGEYSVPINRAWNDKYSLNVEKALKLIQF